VEIPSGYWKIIFLDSGPQSGQYAAFVLDQATPRDANFCDIIFCCLISFLLLATHFPRQRPRQSL
jgi:hypothetical protein